MNITEFLDGTPLWGIFLVSVVIILISSEIGFQLGRRQRRKSGSRDKIQTGPVVAASLGLLAFILAFTFGSVNSRYDERKQLVIMEANAIGTAFLRADVLPKTERNEVRRILYDYVSLRVDMAKSKGLEKVRKGIVRSEELQRELWSRVVAIANKQPTPTLALLLQSLNELIDLHGERVTVSLHHRMPNIFWGVLFSLIVLTMIVGGYDAGLTGGRRSITTFLIPALAFSVVLLLIMALDRPKQQLSILNQAALIDLQKSMQHSMKNP